MKDKPFVIRLFCPCGGQIKWKGGMKPTNPPLYSHYCSGCKKVFILKEKYPKYKKSINDENQPNR